MMPCLPEILSMRSWLKLSLFLALLHFAVACADGDLSANYTANQDQSPSTEQDTGTSGPDNQNAQPSADTGSGEPTNTTNTTPDAGFDDAGQDPTPTPDAGPSEPADTGDQDPEDTGGEDPVDCCTLGDIECDDTNYRVCEEVSPGCGGWSTYSACPNNQVCNPSSAMYPPCTSSCGPDTPNYNDQCTVGVGACQSTGYLQCGDDDQLQCSASPRDPEPKQCNGIDSNCDGTVDSMGICEPCVDDSYAPDNYVSETAPLINPGQTLSGLVLCDNGDPGLASHNFFYLGELSVIDVELDWDDAYDELALDLWFAFEANAAFGERVYLGHAPYGSPPNRYFEDLGDDSVHIYARVFFNSDPPPSGIPFSITHLD